MAAPYTRTQAKKGACGIVVGPNTPGVAHPVLPCGVKIYLEFRGREVLTQVVDHGHTAPGRTFDVTLPVAKLLGLAGHADDSLAFRVVSATLRRSRPCAWV